MPTRAAWPIDNLLNLKFKSVFSSCLLYWIYFQSLNPKWSIVYYLNIKVFNKKAQPHHNRSTQLATRSSAQNTLRQREGIVIKLTNQNGSPISHTSSSSSPSFLSHVGAQLARIPARKYNYHVLSVLEEWWEWAKKNRNLRSWRRMLLHQHMRIAIYHNHQ